MNSFERQVRSKYRVVEAKQGHSEKDLTFNVVELAKGEPHFQQVVREVVSLVNSLDQRYHLGKDELLAAIIYEAMEHLKLGATLDVTFNG